MVEVKDLQILEKLGGGNFGEVYRGIAWGTNQVAGMGLHRKRINIIVKKLKDKQQMDDVIAEAYVFTYLFFISITNYSYSRIKHPSCVYFLGIHRSPDGQSFIVTEFLPNGNKEEK